MENVPATSSTAPPAQSKTAFMKLDASEEALVNETSGVTEIDSVCMSCFKQGRTKLLLTRIPFYRDVIISSFACEHCNIINNGIESANKIQDKGLKYKVLVSDAKDLNREIVKSDYAVFQIPLIDFEIPARTQKGYLSTVEGILDRVISNVQGDIEVRKSVDPETTEKMEAFLQRLQDLKGFKLGPFEIILDDPSGDSFVENLNAPAKDRNMTVTHYTRNKEQNELLGLDDEEEKQLNESEPEPLDFKNEVVQFHSNCPNCNAICETNMKLTDIPFFKSVILMCTICESCGVRSSEVKSGTGIEPKGCKYSLRLTDASDLNRDLLKSENASLEIPEIEFSMGDGTLGGKFTTIEGILKDCVAQLNSMDTIFASRDSETSTKAVKMQECIDTLELIHSGKKLDVTIVIDDPSGTSYLQNLYAPEEDPNMKVEHYERTFDQNEILGLNDMKTENYKEDE